MKARSLFMLCLLIAQTQLSLAALNPPSLRCLEVMPNGDVTLSWVIPSDPTSVFDSYQIYQSTSVSGPYTLIATVPVYTQNTYLHVGANAQTQQNFYYLVTVSDAPVFQYSVPGDTLSTMLLTASNPLNGTAPLVWNSMHSPALATAGNYSIYSEYPAGVWNLTGSTSLTSFLDTIDVCNSQINYRIELPDASGCFSVSSIDGDIYMNTIPPDIPVLDSVSVDRTTQNAILGWQPSASGDTEGYIVYQFTGVWTPVDTVWGIITTFYEYLPSNAGTASESYCIAAIDSCGTTSPLTSGHSTVFLSSYVDACTRSVQLNWSAYAGFSNIERYLIYFSENGGPYSLLDSVSGATLSYSALNLADGSVFCFYVQAWSAGGLHSSSNMVCNAVDFPDLPAYVYIRHASVNADNTVDIKWVNDNTTYVLAYSLQRSLSQDGPWTSVDYKTYTATAEYTFTDGNANPDLHPVWYRVAVIDSCNSEAMYSDTVKTIFLAGTPNNDLTNELNWNDYQGWPTGAQEYQLLRSVDQVPEVTPCATFTSGIEWYTDDVAPFPLSYGLFSYRLMGIEAPGNPLGFSDTTYSNSIDIQQIPRLFMANAFVPTETGYNKTFCPFGVFIDHQTYSFIIFNELGEEMFNTTDFYECWDGTNDGEPAPCGVYHYILHLTLPDNKEFNKLGHITLIR